MDSWEAACKVAREERALMKVYADETTADLRRERERANEWEGLAAGRLAALRETRDELEGVIDGERAMRRNGIKATKADKARITLLEAFLEKHEQWEAKLIQDRYSDGALDAMSPELYEATRAMQDERNALLGRCGAKLPAE